MPKTGMATSWLGRYRRFSNKYEGLSPTLETWILLTMKDHMMHRLSAGYQRGPRLAARVQITLTSNAVTQ